MVSDATSMSYGSSLTTRRVTRSPSLAGVRYSSTSSAGRPRVSQSVERDRDKSITGLHDVDGGSFRLPLSRGTSPAVLSAAGLLGATSACRRRYSVSSSSPSASAGFTTLDRNTVSEIDHELDRTSSSAAASLMRWSRQRASHNDVVYTAEGPRPIDSAGYGVRSRSSSRKPELNHDAAGDINGGENADDVIRRRTRLAMARSRSRAMSLPRFESTSSVAHRQPLQAPTVSSRISTNRASSVTRSPSGVFSSSSAAGSVSSGRSGSSYMAEVPVIERGGRGGWDIASFVLHPGEKFVPTDVSVCTLPSGQKAVTYTRFSQTGHGDHGSANIEIERVIQRTKRMQESMHTLENFVKRNRTLFPEDIIIYQHIVFYLLDAAELKRLAMAPDAEVYGVKVRERLVAPYGTDVTGILKRYYSRHTEVEVEYLEQEVIRRRLRDEMGEEETVENLEQEVIRKRLRDEMGEEKTIEDETTARRRRRQRTDVEETTETDTETLHRRHNKQRQTSSVGSADQKLYIDEEETTTTKRRDTAPYFTTKLKPKRAGVGDMVRMSCSVEGNPSPSVTWYRGNTELVANQRYHFNNTFGLCTLNISSLRKEDEGIYTMRAVNRAGEVTTCAELLVDEEESRVLNEQSTRKPWFLIDARNVTVDVGEVAVLEAQVTGKPLPKFIWQKDNVDVDLDHRIRKASDELGNIKLIISDVRPSDAGVYVCTAENSGGKTTCAAALRVLDGHKRYEQNGYTEAYSMNSSWSRQESSMYQTEDHELTRHGRKPTFTELPPATIELYECDALTLRCAVDGSPRPVVTWYKGVRELTYSERHRILTESDKRHMMQVKRTLQTDPGEYTAVATNSHGHASFTVHVNVLPRQQEDIDLSTDKRHPALREYELIKKMKQGKMAPVFIRKLPIEKTIKVGQSLVIKCCIQEAKMSEYLSGIDIVVKDNIQPVPDFVFTRADVASPDSSTAETASSSDNDAVALTVLKDVVHVIEDQRVNDATSSFNNADVTDEPIDNGSGASNEQESLSADSQLDEAGDVPQVIQDEQANIETELTPATSTPDVPVASASSTRDEITASSTEPPPAAAVTDNGAAASIESAESDKPQELTNSASEQHIPSESVTEAAHVVEPEPALPSEKLWKSDEDETTKETPSVNYHESEPSLKFATDTAAVNLSEDASNSAPHAEDNCLETTDGENITAGSDATDQISAADSCSEVVAQLNDDAADVVMDDVIADEGPSVVSDGVTVVAGDDVASAVCGSGVDKKRKPKRPKKAESEIKDGEEPEEEAKKSKKSGKLKKKPKKKDDGDVGTDQLED